MAMNKTLGGSLFAQFRRNNFVNRAKNFTQENITALNRPILLKSKTIKNISVTSDPIQSGAGFNLQYRAMVKKRDNEMLRDFLHIVEISMISEEKSYKNWAAPKRRNPNHNRNRRFSALSRKDSSQQFSPNDQCISLLPQQVESTGSHHIPGKEQLLTMTE